MMREKRLGRDQRGKIGSTVFRNNKIYVCGNEEVGWTVVSGKIFYSEELFGMYLLSVLTRR